ncbi:MAG TPA: tetratricopeptide repeat protein [Candidatus Eisenbacteria bacterium]|jgi:TolA-binding protein
MRSVRRVAVGLGATTVALLVAGWIPGAPALARAPGRGDKPVPATLKEVGDVYESQRALVGADRVAALDQAQQSVAQVLRGRLDADERLAARLLDGRIQYERSDFKAAGEAFRSAVEAQGKSGFAADAAFGAIEALEAEGRDAEAAREWEKWEKKYPQSPLITEARLHQAWNLIRRGEIEPSLKRLAALGAGPAWVVKDPRFVLAKSTALYLTGKADQALAELGPKTTTAPATYLRAMCLQKQGALLKAAAAFQEVAGRYPDSPLRDPALLAKADMFLAANDYRSAGEEFARVARLASDPQVQAEAELRHAGAVFLGGGTDSALVLLRRVVEHHAGTDVAARAQFLVGEALVSQGKASEAIVELNRVLTTYFQHKVAASAQYRVARCLDALGRHADATGSYQAVVAGYPLEPEAPAAAYLAGVGLMTQGRPLAAAPYFQLVLDRYAVSHDPAGHLVFASPSHQELVEAALCLLELSYHRAGNLGQLTGAPHLLLHSMPESHSPWRAYALLIDADASAAQARYPEAQATLEKLMKEYPDHALGASATKLLAWTYARQGQDSLAIATEERLLARYGASGNEQIVSGAVLDIAHERFNQKRYREAGGAYEDFLRRFPGHPKRLMALYQAGLCYLRLDRAGDAVDRWETIVRDSGSSSLAERAWARAGDVYFQAEKYEDAKRCYQGLLKNFAGSSAGALAMLRLAQCEYNAGHDGAALEAYSSTIERFPGTPAAREATRGTERALYRLSQSPRGAEVLARLVEQYPTSAFAADAQFQIAKRLYQDKHYREAADGFRRVVSQFPGYSAADQAQFLLADAYAQAKAPDEARQAYEQFLSFFPSSELASTVSFRLGLMRFESKDYTQAAVAFMRALEDTASREVRSAARYNLALCQRLVGQTEEARKELESYRGEFPNDARAAEIAYQLGDLNESAGRAAEAAQEYEHALEARPAAALAVELHFRLGRVREQLGDPNGALKAYQGAMASPDRSHPFRLSAVARCAALYEAKKDYARALVAYRDIMRNAKDPELVAAADGRISQLEAGARKR